MTVRTKWKHVVVNFPKEYPREITASHTTYYRYYTKHGKDMEVNGKYLVPKDIPAPKGSYYDVRCTCHGSTHASGCQHNTTRYYYRSATSNRRYEYHYHNGNTWGGYFGEGEQHASRSRHTVYLPDMIRVEHRVPANTWFVNGQPTILALYVRDLVNSYIAEENTKGFAGRKTHAYERAAQELGYSSHTKIQVLCSNIKRYFENQEETLV